MQASSGVDMSEFEDKVTFEHLMQIAEIRHSEAPAAIESAATFPPLPSGRVNPVAMAADTLVGQPYVSLLQSAVNLSAPLDYFVSRADVPAIVNQVCVLTSTVICTAERWTASPVTANV